MILLLSFLICPWFSLSLLTAQQQNTANSTAGNSNPAAADFDRAEVERRLEAQMMQAEMTPTSSPARHPLSQAASSSEPAYASITRATASTNNSQPPQSPGSNTEKGSCRPLQLLLSCFLLSCHFFLFLFFVAAARWLESSFAQKISDSRVWF